VATAVLMSAAARPELGADLELGAGTTADLELGAGTTTPPIAADARSPAS